MSVALLIIAIFSITYYLVLAILAGRANFGFGWIWIVLCGLCLICIILCNITVSNIPGIILLCLIAVTAVFCFTWYIKIRKTATNSFPSEKPGYLIVLGAHVRGTTVSKSLKVRLDKTAEEYRRSGPDKIIVSGGQGKGENISEAMAMKDYLITKDIPETVILTEDKSVSTLTNLKYSLRLMDNPDILTGIVSADYHILRAMMTAKKTGFTNIYPVPAKCTFVSSLHNYIRESFALTKYYLSGNLK